MNNNKHKIYFLNGELILSKRKIVFIWKLNQKIYYILGIRVIFFLKNKVLFKLNININ